MIWNKRKINILKIEIEKGTSLNEISKIINIPEDKIKRKKNALKLKYNKVFEWNEENISFVKEKKRMGWTNKRIAIELDIEIETIRYKSIDLKLARCSKTHWTKEHSEKVKQLSKDGHTKPQIAKILDKTIHQISYIFSKFNLTRTRKMKCWTEEETKKLFELMKNNYSLLDISKKLDRSASSIFGKIRGYSNFPKRYMEEYCVYKTEKRKDKSNDIEYAFKERLNNIEKRCKSKNIPFDLTIDYVISLYNKQNRKCFYSGVDIQYQLGSTNVVSIDRVNSKIGYIKSNIVLSLRWVNTMKLDKSYQEFLEMCKKIVNNKTDFSIINS